MSDNNTRIDVCVATYKRPAMLGKLLHSLCQQTLDEDMEVHIVVVDNDAAGSACEVVERYAATGEMNVRYEKEPVQNIALARNRALSLCAGDYVAFIDDDEEATSEWLRHLLHTARKVEADTVFGPVVPVYPDNTPKWVRRGRYFERARYRTGTLCPHGSTNNVLVFRKTLVATGVQFDQAYGRTGGEDTNFFYRLGQRGARMVWCDEALVHEAVPEDRMTPTWLIKRAYRGGQMHARLFISPKPPLARVLWVAQRVTYLTAAVLALPLAWLWGKEKGVRVLMKISSNFGLTEKLSIQSSFQLSDTTYEDGARLGLVDYELFGGSGGLLYQMTEQDQIQLSGSYVNFHTTNAPLSFRAGFPGVNLSLTHAFTESLTGTAYGGPRFVSSTTQTVSDNVKAQSTVWLFGASLAKRFESTSIQVNVDRDIVPSGFGLLIQRDRAGLTVSHDLTETLTASFNGSGFLVSGIASRAEGGTFPESRYFYLTPKVAWKILEWWKLELSYTYGWRDVDGPSDPAMSNATMFMLTYYPPKLAFSN